YIDGQKSDDSLVQWTVDQIKSKIPFLNNPTKTIEEWIMARVNDLVPKDENHAFLLGAASTLTQIVDSLVPGVSNVFKDAVTAAVGNFTSITHNRLYVPPDTKSLRFDIFEPFSPYPNAKVKVTMTSADPGAQPEVIGSVTLAPGFFKKTKYA